MKRRAYTEIICKGFCPFYSRGKEELTCGTYNFLSGTLTPRELAYAVRKLKTTPDLSCDRAVRKLVCEKCDFLSGGCDFREGLDSPPCGGYAIVERLLRGESSETSEESRSTN